MCILKLKCNRFRDFKQMRGSQAEKSQTACVAIHVGFHLLRPGNMVRARRTLQLASLCNLRYFSIGSYIGGTVKGVNNVPLTLTRVVCIEYTWIVFLSSVVKYINRRFIYCLALQKNVINVSRGYCWSSLYFSVKYLL